MKYHYMRLLEQLIAVLFGAAGYFIPYYLGYRGDTPLVSSYTVYVLTQLVICFRSIRANRKMLSPKQNIKNLVKESRKKINNMQLNTLKIKELQKGRASTGFLNKFFSYISPEQNPVVNNINILQKTANSIIQNVKNDPGSLNSVNKFFIYYLDSAETIVDNYVTILRQNMYTPEVTEQLKKAEDSIAMMVPVFEQYQLMSIEGNMNDIDIESSVLRKTVNPSTKRNN